MQKKISVIVPIFNNEERITRCITSILNQTYSNLELIVVNDGSTDHSEEKILSFDDKRLIYIAQKNSGPSKARNNALNMAKGDYILFVDSDDYIEPDMIRRLLDEAESKSADIVCCNMKQKRNELLYKEIKEPYKEKQTWQEFYINFVIYNGTCSLCNKLIKKKLFEHANFYEDIRLGEDSSLLLRILPYANNIAHINEPFYIYDLTHEGISSKWKKSVYEYMIAIKRVILFYKDQKIELPLSEVLLRFKVCYFTLFFCTLGNAKKLEYWDYFLLAEDFYKDFKTIIKTPMFYKYALKYKLFAIVYFMYYSLFFRHFYQKKNKMI